MKPIIGITTNFEDEKNLSVHKSNYNRIIEAGGIPVILPITSDVIAIKDLVSSIDGVLFTGGLDVDPVFYNEDPLQQLQDISPGRDGFEFALVKELIDKHTPILAICRGAQVVNVALGGSLYQDIPTQVGKSAMQHVQKAKNEHLSHSITIDPDSKFGEIYNTEEIRVNSFHHQSVKELGEGLKAVAHANDGIIEAIESTTNHFILGTQWHPEYIEDEATNRLFEVFVNECKK